MKKLLRNLYFPNKFIPLIVGVGLAIGLANYAMGFYENLGPALLLQTITSVIIGYGLLLIVYNQQLLFSKSLLYRYLSMGGSFVLISLIASELELLNRAYLFGLQDYQFMAGKGIYLFNAILTLILGISFNQFWVLKTTQKVPQAALPNDHQKGFVPVKKGSDTLLINISEIVYFEASDNFSFLVTEQGQKLLCDYSLLQLQELLSQQFVRVHRKYIINSQRVEKITPYFKGRFQITFNAPGVSFITSSASYSTVVKNLIRL